jgi:RNA-directed DNA polymerase
MIIVRYADDIVVGFQHETDARRFWDAMRERLQEFTLTLHPEKTRPLEFGRHAAVNGKRRGLGKPETFSFLGFTFICGKSLRGKFLLKRRSRRDRMKAKLKEIGGELRRRMHLPIPQRGAWLRDPHCTGFMFRYFSNAVYPCTETPSECRCGASGLWADTDFSSGRRCGN